ncbi:MAG: UDP-N-acetylmuramoyl-tripeptide--D-alanyl-D-alanine ligase [Ruminococcus sp.]|jgi:UDP-N-acetylmuramoyl-tripeptide--D-alanyl-D-alanine ligase
MKNLSLRNIASACGGILHASGEVPEQCVKSITTDSRKAEEGCLFVPIVGARADGHDFIEQVMEKGALGTLSEREIKDADYPYIQVKSSLQAVKDIAEFYLKQLDIPVVGITGSVGKTSTKEMIAAVLSQKYRVLKTQGNFNNELGMPLTVFRLREEDEIAVLELGISDFEEMHRLAKVARPDTCVITNIGYCHLENLKSLDGVLKAKTEMFDYMKKDGAVILNGDDGKLRSIQEVHGKKPVFFGVKNSCDIYADHIENLGLKGIACCIHTDIGEFKVQIPAPGEHSVYNALAGAAVGRTYGLSLEEIRRGIESPERVSGRFRIIEMGNYTVIDDCYNANPVSMKASLKVLQDAEGRKVAVLGDMGELGEDEVNLHREVGAFAASCDIGLLVCVGDLSRHMADGAKEKNPGLEVIYIKDREELLEVLPNMIQKGDTILIKASHFMQFEKVVKRLVSE